MVKPLHPSEVVHNPISVVDPTVLPPVDIVMSAQDANNEVMASSTELGKEKTVKKSSTQVPTI